MAGLVAAGLRAAAAGCGWPGSPTAQVTDVTDGRFTDTEPVFTIDGKYLAFLSKRNFDPVYDAHFFDLAFPFGARPYLIPLAAATLSPFGPQPGGRQRRRGRRGRRRRGSGDGGDCGTTVRGDGDGGGEATAAARPMAARPKVPAPVAVDTDGHGRADRRAAGARVPVLLAAARSRAAWPGCASR